MAHLESETQTAVRELREKGWPARDIALELGISTQRVYQQLAKIKAKDDALPATQNPTGTR